MEIVTVPILTEGCCSMSVLNAEQGILCAPDVLLSCKHDSYS